MARSGMALLISTVLTATTASLAAVDRTEPVGNARGILASQPLLTCAVTYVENLERGDPEPDLNFSIVVQGDEIQIVGDLAARSWQTHRVDDSASFIAWLPMGGVTTITITPSIVDGVFVVVASRHRIHITPERRAPQLVISQSRGYCFRPRE